MSVVAAEGADFHYGGHVMEIEAHTGCLPQKPLALWLQHMIWRVGLLPLVALYKTDTVNTQAETDYVTDRKGNIVINQ